MITMSSLLSQEILTSFISFFYYIKLFIFHFSDLIKNKTLEFFSKTLPILKADDTLPKVAKFQDPPKYFYQRPPRPQ